MPHNSYTASLQTLFTIGRTLKHLKKEKESKTDANGVRTLFGEFLLEEGIANTPGLNIEDGLTLVELLQSLVDGDSRHEESSLAMEMEGFIELSLFDPYDEGPSDFYFVLLAYSRKVVDDYVDEMHRNLLLSPLEGERGLIIPDGRTYTKPLYKLTSSELASNLFAVKRNKRPTLYMGLFPSDPLLYPGASNVETAKAPQNKVKSFLYTVSTRLVTPHPATDPTVPINAAFLLTFPKPVGPRPSSEDEYLRGGGLFVYGNYENDLSERAILIQSRILREVMKVSYTQADAFRAVELSEESSRQARAHELRRLIGVLDAKVPDCILREIIAYFRLVIAFESLDNNVPRTLRALIFNAAEKACKLAIACEVGQQKLWEKPSHWSSRPSGTVLPAFNAEVSKRKKLDLDVGSQYDDLSHLSDKQLENFFMALVCLLRNVYCNKRDDSPCIVRLRLKGRSPCVAITNYADSSIATVKSDNIDCNTEKAGKYYVGQFGGDPSLFSFKPLTTDSSTGIREWLSICSLPPKKAKDESL